MGFEEKDHRFYEFGSFRIEAANHLLLQDGRPVALQPKTFDLLLLLVERAGEVVSKEEIMTRLWPETVVEEANLTQNVYLLRKILGRSPDGQTLIETIPKRGYKFTGVVVAARRPEADPPPPPPAAGEKPIRRRPMLWLLLILLLAACGVSATWLWRRDADSRGTRPPAAAPRPPLRAPFASVKLSKLTDFGKVWRATISADGKYLAYSLYDEREGDSLWVKNLPSESTMRIGAPTKAGYESPAFSPDGNYLYYASNQNWPCDIYAIPVLGGAARQIAAEAWSAFALSPDGKQLAFVRRHPDRSESVLVIADLNGSERQIAARREPETFGLKSVSPAWAPDGRKIACVAGDPDGAGLIEYAVADGAARVISAPGWKTIDGLVWLPNGAGWLITATEKDSDVKQIYYLAEAGGAARRVTNDLSDYGRLSLTADGRLLVAEQVDEVTNLWIAPVGSPPAGETARQVTFRNSRGEGYRGATWTPDGKLVFASEQNGRCDIWMSDGHGRNKKLLTAGVGRLNQQPSVSPDGKTIAFLSDRAGRLNVWVMGADGSASRQLTFGEGESDPTFTPDGRAVIYTAARRDGGPAIWRKYLEGNDDPVQVIADGTRPTISPDGKFMTYNFTDETDGRRPKTAVVTIAENKLVKILPVHRRDLYRWSPDGKRLTYISEMDSNVWSVSPDGDGDVPRQITRLPPNGGTRWFDWSPDGRRLVLVRSVVSSDAVLLSDETPERKESGGG